MEVQFLQDKLFICIINQKMNYSNNNPLKIKIMTRAIDLYSKEWCDLVFGNRNQTYGACEIRRNSSRRHLMSIGIVTILGLAIALSPNIIKKFFPTEKVEPKEIIGPVTLMNPYQEKQQEILNMAKSMVVATPDLKKTIKFTTLKITEDDKVSDEDEIMAQAAMSDSNAGISIANVEGVEGGKADIADYKDKVFGEPAEASTPFEVVEQMPSLPGGEKELMSYLSKNIKYPVIAQEQGIQGNVVLRFVVSKDGSVTDVTIMRSLDPSCDKEAIRVVKSMPKWIPGRQNGIPVAVFYTLPIRFRLEKI